MQWTITTDFSSLHVTVTTMLKVRTGQAMSILRAHGGSVVPITLISTRHTVASPIPFTGITSLAVFTTYSPQKWKFGLAPDFVKISKNTDSHSYLTLQRNGFKKLYYVYEATYDTSKSPISNNVRFCFLSHHKLRPNERRCALCTYDLLGKLHTGP